MAGSKGRKPQAKGSNRAKPAAAAAAGGGARGAIGKGATGGRGGRRANGGGSGSNDGGGRRERGSMAPVKAIIPSDYSAGFGILPRILHDAQQPRVEGQRL